MKDSENNNSILGRLIELSFRFANMITKKKPGDKLSPNEEDIAARIKIYQSVVEKNNETKPSHKTDK